MTYLLRAIVALAVAYWLGQTLNTAYLRLADRLADVRVELTERRIDK